jgi:predicted porin
MKLKLALLSCVFGMSAAHAQVSIYGIIDTSIQTYNNGTERYTRAADSQYATSRLGFRGTEDLGGGLRAFFQLEGQLNPSVGSMGSSTTVVTNEIFNRDSFVGLEGSLGSIRIGKTDVALVGETDVFISQAGNFGFHPLNGTSVELGTDQKNVVRYGSPTIQGFTLILGQTSNNSGSTTDANTTQRGATLRYELNNIKAAIGIQKNDGAGVAKRDTTTAGLAYNFGVFSIGTAYAKGDNSTTADFDSSSSVTSIRVPLINKFAAHAVYATTKTGARSTDNQGQGYTLLLTKDLSKRTTLYAQYSRVNNQSNSSMRMFNATTAPTTAGLDTNSAGLGISHRF